MSSVNFAQPDITLMLDEAGVIRGASVSNAMGAEGVSEWLGRPWVDTVGEVGSDRVRRMLDDARRNGVSAFRQVTQRFPSGLELPVEYTTVRLGGGGGLIAVGKNLQAVAELQSRLIATQQAREQDYWKLREIETRSRLLFDASSEAVLLAHAETLCVVEANPAAVRALGIVPGWDIMREVAPADHDALQGLLGRARKQGRVPAIMVRLGTDPTPWIVRATMTTAESGPVFMLQLGQASQPLPVPSLPGSGLPLDALVDRLPDAFLVVDPRGVIQRANQAFLDLVQAPAEGAVVGERIGRWLSQPGAAAAGLFARLQQHGSVRAFTTRLTGDLGAEADVEISASGLEGDRGLVAIVMRDVSRRMPTHDLQDRLRATLGAVTERVGKTPLPVLVRDLAEIVERHCIETALRMSEGKRTAAAEMLGLSRQSLYSKLERYRIGDNPEGTAEGTG